MFERDFLDLLDDLSHENGHHYLNTILNYSELLDEDDDKIYFSPWRRALRPVRGIYHAVFTFYWAFDLFNSLAQAQHADLKEYRERILLRACEEHFMLLYCRPYIDHAFKNKKITKEGMELINTVFALLSQESKNVELMIEVLKKQYSKSFSKISELKLTLNEKAKHYKL
jgi:HEXXH motif-containing protein